MQEIGAVANQKVQILVLKKKLDSRRAPAPLVDNGAVLIIHSACITQRRILYFANISEQTKCLQSILVCLSLVH